jgi:hypothetical protein
MPARADVSAVPFCAIIVAESKQLKAIRSQIFFIFPSLSHHPLSRRLTSGHNAFSYSWREQVFAMSKTP